jgi:hypothetical protein
MHQIEHPTASDRVILYTSYPKTGSTFVPSLVDRLRDASPDYEAETFVFGKSKNNVRVRHKGAGTLYQLKTHHTAEDFFRRNRAELQHEVPALRSFMAAGVAGLGDPGRGFIYSLRNPFATLASAIQYSKLVYTREGEAAKWIEDGRAARHFVQLLGLKAVPSPDEYQSFKFLDLPTSWIEDICWRYVDSRGSIPFLETEGMPTYFEHVNHHQAHLTTLTNQCVLTYEQLMAGDEASLQALGHVLDVPASHLRRALDAEEADRQERSGRYNIPFFANFQVATPAAIGSLPSWRQVRDRTLALCPPLVLTLSATA